MKRSYTCTPSSSIVSVLHGAAWSAAREESLRKGGADFYDQAGADIDPRNSALDFDFVKRLSKSSIASTVERGLKTLRSTHTRLSSSGGRSSSSLRVPER